MVPSLPINSLPNTHLAALLYDMVYCTQFQANTKQSSCGLWLVKNKSPPFGLVSSFTGIHASRAGSVVDTEEASNLEDCFEQKLSTDSSEENAYADKVQLASCSERLIDKYLKEQERRRKISLANKGKRKGQKHSPETRRRISESMKAALKNPKVKSCKNPFGLLNKTISPRKKDSSFTGIHTSRAGSVVDTEEASNLEDRFKQKLSTDSPEENTNADKIQLASCSQKLIDKNQIEQERRRKISIANKGKQKGKKHSPESQRLIDKNQMEQERRRKISIANKGKRKGQKHSPETRQRISESMKAALMDPKIREKMTSSYVLSDESKARMSKSLTRVWGKKLKWKRSREKFLSSWAGSLAEAAKRGGSGQHQLQWDSYDKIKEEIAIEQRNQPVQARKRRATPREKKLRKIRKSEEEKEALDIALKINERLAKLHKRMTSTNGQISSEDQQAWEKFDLEFVKKKQIRRPVSLADQIRAAKTKRVENVARERLPAALHLEGNQHSEGFS